MGMFYNCKFINKLDNKKFNIEDVTTIPFSDYSSQTNWEDYKDLDGRDRSCLIF